MADTPALGAGPRKGVEVRVLSSAPRQRQGDSHGYLGIEGKVAVIGGASSGLGRACATRLVEEGCHVLLWARRAEPLAETARELRARSRGRVETLVADAADPASAELVARRALEAFGRVDTLVLNAGGPPASGTPPSLTRPRCAMRCSCW